MRKKFLSPLTFKTGVMLNAFGSSLFEGLKLAHQALLFSSLSLEEYGKVGTLFSLIFAAISFSGLALEATVPVFINEIFFDRTACRAIIGRLVFFQIILLSIGSLGVLFFIFYVSSSIPLSPLLLTILAITIISEGLRIFFRSTLHARAIHTAPILCELATMIGYYLWIWIPFFRKHNSLSLDSIFFPYVVCSLAALGILSLFLYFHYTTLPSKPKNSVHLFPWKRFFKARMLTYGSRLSSTFFTGNVLVPFFMIRFGLRESGLFKFASYGIDALKGILHATIGFSSSALFARVKYASWNEKRKAFYEASSILNAILIGIIIFIIFTRCSFSFLYPSPAHTLFFIFLTFFFLLFLCEQSMLVYEKLYYMEERSDILIVTKMAELVCGIGILYLSYFYSSLFILLFLLCCVRSASCLLTGWYAYRLWNIIPPLKIRFMPCFISLVISCIISLFYTLVISGL